MPLDQTAATIQVISGPLLKSGLGLLFKYGTHQTINGRLEQVYLPSDPMFGMAWGGAIIPAGFEEMQGPKCEHYSSHPLGHYLCQASGPWPGKAPV